MRVERLKELGQGAEERSKEAVGRLVDAAADAGLVDVGYGFVDSPLGRLMVAVTSKGIVAVSYPDHDVDADLERLAKHVSPRVIESSRATEDARRQMDEYFDGRRTTFDIPVDLSLVAGFTTKVLRTTAQIPYGTLSTYRDVAAGAGNARAYRAAGNALGSNPIPVVVPCHRVVKTGGALGGYGGGLDKKITLLRLEGVDV